MASALEAALAAALNRLLATESWARARLAPFAGRAVELEFVPAPPFRFALAEGGFVSAAPPELEPALRLRLGPASLLALVRGEEHFLRSVVHSGDESLAAALAELFRHLRWDWEEELAGWVGDPVAHAIGEAFRALRAELRQAARRAAAGLAEYAAGDGRLLLGRAEFERLREAVARLRDGVERLERRVERLEG